MSIQTTVAECIAVPFIMPEPDPDAVGRVSCFIERDHGELVMVTEGWTEPIVGGYRTEGGMLVLVSKTAGGSFSVDVIVPTEHKLFYAGIMRKTPAKRFEVCTPGKNFYYQSSKRERLPMEQIEGLLIKYGGKLPLALDCDNCTELPEAVIGG